MRKISNKTIEKTLDNQTDQESNLSNDIDFEHESYIQDCITSMLDNNSNEKFKNSDFGKLFKESYFQLDSNNKSAFYYNSYIYGFLMQVSFKYSDIVEDENSIIYKFIESFKEVKNAIGLGFVIRIRFKDTDMRKYHQEIEMFADINSFGEVTDWTFSDMYSYEELIETVNKTNMYNDLKSFEDKFNCFSYSNHPVVIKNDINVKDYIKNKGIVELQETINQYIKMEEIVEY